MPILSLHSPVGDLTVFEADGALVALEWGWASDQEASPLLRDVAEQLNAYFDGTLQTFDVPLAPSGTVFQKQVYQAMIRIPYGHTRRYGEIAAELESAPRAVGQACGRNPIPIIIPCHRVLGSGHAGGYSGDGGLVTKHQLLVLEGALMA